MKRPLITYVALALLLIWKYKPDDLSGSGRVGNYFRSGRKSMWPVERRPARINN